MSKSFTLAEKERGRESEQQKQQKKSEVIENFITGEDYVNPLFYLTS